ncbi:1-phosphofructokinase family hexose kinase [Uniformispora flossi]|uniref:1-phosphofructokinase family hexose kinase n=1 Tax=Uniformispora flossi TaxID=3390723 RepID=UPI003C2E63A1
MIVTVTANPALDVTYHLDRVAWHGSNRVEDVAARAGGKGVNVARVLAALGIPAAVLGPVGGRTGEQIREDLAAAGLRDATVPVAAESRRTTTVVDASADDATVFNEAGPHLGDADWARLRDAYDALLGDARGVALCGSLPPGAPTDLYAGLVRRARDAGVPVLLDTSGPAFRAGLAAGPDLVKPNADELRDATGESDPGQAVAALSAMLRAAGGDAVVASLGPRGLRAATGAGWWRARLPYAIHGNPTGAGDAGVAALLAGLTAGRPWPDLLAEAVAWSASAVAAPLAGSVDRTTYATARAHVLVSATEPPERRPPDSGPRESGLSESGPSESGPSESGPSERNCHAAHGDR